MTEIKQQQPRWMWPKSIYIILYTIDEMSIDKFARFQPNIYWSNQIKTKE